MIYQVKEARSSYMLYYFIHTKLKRRQLTMVTEARAEQELEQGSTEE
jgi:hypothetical protein